MHGSSRIFAPFSSSKNSLRANTFRRSRSEEFGRILHVLPRAHVHQDGQMLPLFARYMCLRPLSKNPSIIHPRLASRCKLNVLNLHHSKNNATSTSQNPIYSPFNLDFGSPLPPPQKMPFCKPLSTGTPSATLLSILTISSPILTPSITTCNLPHIQTHQSPPRIRVFFSLLQNHSPFPPPPKAMIRRELADHIPRFLYTILCRLSVIR